MTVFYLSKSFSIPTFNNPETQDPFLCTFLSAPLFVAVLLPDSVRRNISHDTRTTDTTTHAVQSPLCPGEHPHTFSRFMAPK